MTLELADRLLSFRKSSGLSQEEVAGRLNISRQAVSRWERGEAMPDLENLLALSDLYSVSLDELVKGTPCPPDETSEAADAEDEPADGSDEESEEDKNEPPKDRVKISPGHIHIEDKNGDVVHVGFDGIYINENGTVHVDSRSGNGTDADPKVDIHIRNGHIIPVNEEGRVCHFLRRFPFPLLAVAAFLLVGFLCEGGWGVSWLVFFTVPLYYSLIDAFAKRNAHIFAYPVLVTGLYLAAGLLYGRWHPEWIIFLTIPAYYSVVAALSRDKHK